MRFMGLIFILLKFYSLFLNIIIECQCLLKICVCFQSADCCGFGVLEVPKLSI